MKMEIHYIYFKLSLILGISLEIYDIHSTYNKMHLYGDTDKKNDSRNIVE